MIKQIKQLKNFYLFILGVLFLIIISTPLLIKEGISFFSEELTESIMLFILFVVSFFIYLLYKNELNKNYQQLDAALNYIGSVNVQIEQIKDIFNDLNKFPKNKSDFKYIQESLAKRVLGIVNSDWVIFRIINTENNKTLSEYCQTRGEKNILNQELSNKCLINNKALKDYFIIESAPKNFKIKTYCILPTSNIAENQIVLIKAIISNLSMFYIIFVSYYYKNTRDKNKQFG